MRSPLRPLAIALAVLLGACTSAPTPPTASPSPAGPTPSSGATATASAGPSASPVATPSATSAPTPTPTVLPSGPLALALAAPLQAVLDQRLAAMNIPGMSAAIIFPDVSLWSSASGLAEVDAGRPVTPDTPFVAGSITKTFVTAATMQLAEEGALSLDDPLSDWLPDYPRAAHITLRMLLNHTSGVFNLFDSPDYTRLVIREGTGRSWSPREVLDNLVGDPYCDPGTCYHYSNTGFVLLGMAIEAETGQPLGTVLRERFFEPLHLGAIWYQGDGPPPSDSARGYVPRSGVNVAVSDGTDYRPTESEATVVGAAGGIVASARNLARWGRALYGGEVVSADSLAQMTDFTYHTEAEGGSYGLGTRTRLFDSIRMFGHTGALRGFNAAMWHLPSLDLTVVVMTNRTRIDANRIVDALLEVALPAVR